MDEKRKVLLWLGGGQIDESNFNFEKYDEVIFIDALKHICWEIESFISQKGISGFVINSAISKRVTTSIFNETSDSDYSFLEGYEEERPNNVTVINKFSVQTMSLADVFALVDLVSSTLSVVCSISGLSHMLCEHALSSIEKGAIDEFYLSQKDRQTSLMLEDGLFKLMRSNFYVRKAPVKRASFGDFSHYIFSNLEFDAAVREEAERTLKLENESLKNKLSQKDKELGLLLSSFESFKSSSTLQMETLTAQTKLIESAQVDNLCKISEVLTEKVSFLENLFKEGVKEAKSSNDKLFADIEKCMHAMLEKIEQLKSSQADTFAVVSKVSKDSEGIFEKVNAQNDLLNKSIEESKQSNGSLLKAIDMAVLDLIEKLEFAQKSTKALVSSSHTNTIKQIEDYSSVRNFIDHGHKPLNFHGWPISPDIAVRIVTMLSTTQYSGILEFGSGTSTALIGRIIQRLIKDKVVENLIPFYSFDHNEMYFERTKNLLKAHSVSEFVTLNHCELVKESFSDTDFLYYDCRQVINDFCKLFKDIKPKFLVLVDGPPGATNPHARYPAFPIILQEINHDEFDLDFLVDDYNRREEKEVVEKWKRDAENAGLSSENEVIISEKGFSIFSVRCKK